MWRARCKPYDEIVAVKLMDLETVNCSLVSIPAQSTIEDWLAVGDLPALAPSWWLSHTAATRLQMHQGGVWKLRRLGTNRSS